MTYSGNGNNNDNDNDNDDFTADTLYEPTYIENDLVGWWETQTDQPEEEGRFVDELPPELNPEDDNDNDNDNN
jgi:hypothetical protein